MADDKTKPTEKTTPAPQEAPAPAAESIVLPDVAAPKNALIGDENLPDAREPGVDVNTDSVPAQTTGKPAEEVTKVYVHETNVTLDEVITDPHSPLAVQIPDAGRGSLDLPIHALTKDGVEAYFDKANAEAQKS